MARGYNAKGRSQLGPPFVQLFKHMLNTPAWRSLTAQERAVYLEVAAIYTGFNNGRLALSVRDAAERAKISKDTAARAFHTLEARGFLDCMSPGGFSRKTPHSTEWRITTHRCDKSGERASNRFRQWAPGENDGPKARRRSPKLATLNLTDVSDVQ